MATRPTHTASNQGTGYSPAQYIALALGIAFVLAGIVGFFVTGFDDFADTNTNETLLGLELNPLHNIVHLALGIPGLLLWRRVDTAKTYLWLLVVGYAAVFVYGLFVAEDDNEANILSLNSADNVFHAAIVVV
ncbi:MAG TPA: DUF4383 domain-containing protein, partial [Acidimicrobiales bacterium]